MSTYQIIMSVMVLLIAAFLTYLFTKGNAQVDTPSDPRQNLTPNNTNYNLQQFDRQNLNELTKEEAQRLLASIETSDQASLSPRDFAILKKKVQ